MLKEVSIEDCLHLTFRKDLKILLLRWLKNVNSGEVKAGYLYALNEAIKLKSNFWFLDLRSRGTLSAEDDNWILNSFFKEVEELFPGNHYFAYLVSPSQYDQINQTLGIEEIRNFSPNISLMFFKAENEAIKWLVNMQRIQKINPEKPI